MYNECTVFEWDDENEGHVAEHGVFPEEAEAVFFTDPMEFPPIIVDGELRYPIVGETESGRILRVAYALRGDRVRVCSAFTAGVQEAHRYAAYRKGRPTR